MIEILTDAPLATIQDLGRHGSYRYGVGRAGAMDGLALRLANILLGNDENAAGIEIPSMPFRIRFLRETSFALTGADCAARIGSRRLPPFWAARAKEGEELSLFPPQAGCRAYLTLAGGLEIPIVLGSRSTQLREGFGGHEGRGLRKGDRLMARGAAPVELPQGGLGALPPTLALPLGGPARETVVRVLPASEHDAFEAASIEAFRSSAWKVTAQSNRAGYRLAGPALAMLGPLEMRSHGVVPGVIQVPPGGAPIIQLADAATMGGYPKIGTVIEADLWRVAQVSPGETIRFAVVDYAAARSALDELDAHLRTVAVEAGWQRGAAGRRVRSA